MSEIQATPALQRSSANPLTKADGTEVRPVYIRNFTGEDWELIEECKLLAGVKETSAAIRWALKHSTGRA